MLVKDMTDLKVKVDKVETAALDIKAFSLVSLDGSALPSFTPGAHIDVHIDNDRIRQYSLYNGPRELDRYNIGVQREENGRGGSKAMHEQVKAGDILTISEPRNHFPLSGSASYYILLAGGIGITPILAMARQLAAAGAEFEMHYCTRSEERAAFADILSSAELKGRVSLHFDDGPKDQLLDLKALLAVQPEGGELYMCGPGGFMNAVKEASAHWSAGSVNMEYFAADPEMDNAEKGSFAVKLAKSGDTYSIPEDKTILQVLTENGVHVQKSCSQGICGTCATGVIEGTPDHRDMVLSDKQKSSNKFITVCCSRSKSDLLVLDL